MISSPAVRTPSSTAVDIVRAHAEQTPDRLCFAFYERGRETERLTCADLVHQATAYATLYRERGLEPGDPLIIFAASVAPLMGAFLGAQLAGLVAVPCPPPEPLESGRRVRERVIEILARCRAGALFDPLPGRADGELGAALAARGTTVLTPADLAGVHGAADADGGRRSAYAYCQFTSGSGGRGKGVLLKHANVLAIMDSMEAGFRFDRERDAAVTWLPFFHDMGLVGYVLLPLIKRFPCHVMTPLAFLTHPAAWPALISRVRGTISAGPNFAYELCARKITDDELAPLDLSSWRIASTGAEPVTRQAVDAFVERFEPCGFRRGSLLPSYGLAENTLGASSRRPGEGPHFELVSRAALEGEDVARLAAPDEPSVTTASVGRALPGQEIAILGPAGTPIGAREIGEVAVLGPCVMSGYLPGTEGQVVVRPDGWLLTGDLGYMADGELFIVGRKKDLIIRAGRNYYPQDLEEAADRVPGVRRGRAVAFSVPGPSGEQVVVAVERRPESTTEPDRLRAAITEAVYATVRFRPDDIVIVPPHALPLTTSGKIMRPEARRLYLEQWSGREARHDV